MYIVLYVIVSMVAYQGMQSFKSENKRKTVLLLLLFPALLLLVFWVVLSTFFTDTGNWEEGWNMTLETFPLVILGLLIWGTISFFWQKDIMFGLSGARAITRKENPKVYNIVENLCISRGLPMPKIAIMDEPGMNAFATGWRQEDSWIAFTSGLLENLDKNEIEAVAGHELTHLINKDSLLMYVSVVFIGVVSWAGQNILRYGRSSSSKKAGGLFIFAIVFLLLGYLFYPLIRLGISRKREYMADLGSVELTMDNQSMISALKKISKNSYVSKANVSISSFFTVEPNVKFSEVDNFGTYAVDKHGKTKTSIRDSHPSIDDRIARLKNY